MTFHVNGSKMMLWSILMFTSMTDCIYTNSGDQREAGSGLLESPASSDWRTSLLLVLLTKLNLGLVTSLTFLQNSTYTQ